MGWWGFGIMEGDEPCDLQYIIESELAGDVFIGSDVGMSEDEAYDQTMAKTAEMAKQALECGDYMEIVSKIKAGEFDSEFDDYDQNIALQVLGEMIMVYGGKMDETVKPIFVEAAEADGWAQGNDERKAEMDAYINRVIAYDGTAIEPTSRGLFDTIFTAIENGQKGLVNK
jgi:hypothetical protein